MITSDIIETVTTCPRGRYQAALINGCAWSGADLRGKARRYSGRYEVSRWSLLRRINRALLGTGWFADSELCLMNSRWRRRLVLINPEGVAIDWLSNAPAHLKY